MTDDIAQSLTQRNGRIERLKERAQAILAQRDNDIGLPMVGALESAKLLEELRIYQVELELQNDELRSAQRAAELAQRRYQVLFEQLPLPALVLDNNAMVDDCNASANALLGNLRYQQPTDARFWRKLNGDDRARLHAALRDLQAGETRCLEQLAVAAGDATAPVFDAHLIGLSMDYKLDRRVLLLLVDRTAELAHAHDQRLFGTLLDSSDSLIYAADKQGQLLLANQALLTFLQRSRADVLGHKREDFLPLRDAIVQTKVDQQVWQSGQAVTLEEQMHLSQGGQALDFLTRKFVLRDSAGAIYGVGGISTDITTLKDQQRQAMLSETVFMTSEEAIIITDANTCILRVNPAFTRQSGFSSETMLGRYASALKSGRQDQTFYASLWQSLNNTGRWSGELNNRRADGSFYTVHSNINAVCDAQQTVLHYIAVQTDVTLLHKARQQLEHQASHDALTGLPNRTLFNDRLAQLIAASKRHETSFALLFIDLDRFKEVNDTMGHPVGDALLRTIAHRLQSAVRTEDTVARVGGDEFVLLLTAVDRARAQQFATTLLERMREPLALDASQHYRPMASLGLAIFPDDGDTPDLLLRNADMAMYGAKLGGRNRLASYTPQMTLANDQAFAIQSELAEAIAQQQLRVFYQPKCRLSDGSVCGAEALVRWQRPAHGLVMPGEFIGVAEKSGLLMALDSWVLGEALRQVGHWLRAGLWRSDWRVAVNRNVLDLQHPDMLLQLQALLAKHQVPASVLELEITEDALLMHTTDQIQRLHSLRDMGVSLAIDDFGTGYSSLAYLSQLPISVIKIDQSFVRSMLSNDNDAVLVHTIVDLAHNLGHTLVAEGIEQPQQLEKLRAVACEFGQGYLFGKPVSADDFEARWLQPFI